MLQVLTWPGAAAPFAPLVRDRATIYFLHRVAVPDLGVAGFDPCALRRWLAHLRRRRYELVSLEEVFRRLEDGRPFQRTVAFTLDDGYFDQAVAAAPLFAEYDCPSTTFVATGFVDGSLWMWWDRLEYVLERASRRRLTVRLPDAEWPVSWSDDAERARQLASLTERLKRVPDAAKLEAIEALAREAEVELPARAPEALRAMSWDELRAAERVGMSFGPHTVTHPILSQTSDEQSRFELEECWRRLSKESASPVPVFCYPNGGRLDFGARELDTLASLGLRGGVLGESGYADRARYRAAPHGRFLVHRFSLDERVHYNVQSASGFERAKELVRRERHA